MCQYVSFLYIYSRCHLFSLPLHMLNTPKSSGIIMPLALLFRLYHIFRWWKNKTNPVKIALHCSTLKSLAPAGFYGIFPPDRLFKLGFLCVIVTTVVHWPDYASCSCCSVPLRSWQPSALQVQPVSEPIWPWLVSHLFYFDLGLCCLTHEDHNGHSPLVLIFPCPYRGF